MFTKWHKGFVFACTLGLFSSQAFCGTLTGSIQSILYFRDVPNAVRAN